MTDLVQTLRELSAAPSQKEAFDIWLEMKDSLAFLKDNCNHEEFVVYAGTPFSSMHAILVPEPLVNPPDADDLMAWSFNASSSWGICHTYSEPPTISITPPLDHTGSKTLDQGEQLVFGRFFDGLLGTQNSDP